MSVQKKEISDLLKWKPAEEARASWNRIISETTQYKREYEQTRLINVLLKIKEFRLGIDDFIRDILKKQEECRKEGHKQPVYFGPHFAFGRNAPNPYKVEGMCRYCLSYIERGLTEEELKEYNGFLESLHKPMTI